VAASLVGCAGGADQWPKMSDFSRITQKVLTPAEQQQAVQSMTAEQQAEKQKAIQEIEKRKGN
jgi:hypothetical protein